MAIPKIDIDALTDDECQVLLEKLQERMRTRHDDCELTSEQEAELSAAIDEVERGEVDGILWEDLYEGIKKEFG